jgi:predicted DNA binding protein
MSVIVELTLPSRAFELGRILTVEQTTRVRLDTMVPLGGRPTPFVRVEDGARDAFERTVREHPSVTDITEVASQGSETLYAFKWNVSDDSLFKKLGDMDVKLLTATGAPDTWELELRFINHEELSDFQQYYTDENIDVTIERIYNPTKPDAGAWYGLTPVQRETLMSAVEQGYYSLPRRVSTQELGERFDISDQAVTERLRRGIETLVTNTLLATEKD